MSGESRESLASPHPLSRRNSWSNPLGLNIFSRGASDTVQVLPESQRPSVSLVLVSRGHYSVAAMCRDLFHGRVEG